jgi:hypothetical protein
MDKTGFNPKTGEPAVVKRRQLFVNEELPIKDEYNKFVLQLIDQSEQ